MADEPDNTKADGAVIQRLVRYTSISEQQGREFVAPAGCRDRQEVSVSYR